MGMSAAFFSLSSFVLFDFMLNAIEILANSVMYRLFVLFDLD